MADQYPDPDSGAAGTEYQTIRALREAGCTVDAVWRDELSHRVSHPNLHELLELPITYRNAMLRRLNRRSYDVVHVSQAHGYLAAWTLRRRCSETAFVHRSHGLEGRARKELRPWLSRYFKDDRPAWRQTLSQVMESALQYNNRMIACCANGHIVSASECKNFLVEHYGVDKDRIAVIPQAPPQAFHDLEARPVQGDRLRRILYVGQFAFFKGPVVLVRAIEQILQAVPDATFTWICDRHYHDLARDLFADKGVLQRVRFLDWMSQTELLQVYDSHGLFLFPSFFEGFGKAFLEAMARGLVVVTSQNGGMRDVIDDGTSGFLVPTGDHAALADRCLSLLHQPKEMERVSIRAREAALRFSWDRVAAETLSFYDKLRRQRQSSP